MVLQYSNQETSVTIGESVRDEDGKYINPAFPLVPFVETAPYLLLWCLYICLSLPDL
jgi:hypothetical protein